MPFIQRYKESTIVYNLLHASRIKKGEEAVDCLNKKKEEDKVVSEYWEEENDDNNYLIICLISNEGSFPWLVAHHGIHEIIKAPLFVPIIKDEHKKNTLSLFLRDFANRGSTCIKRKFYLTFHSSVKAESFMFTHNRMLNAHDEEVLAKKRVEEARKSMHNEKRTVAAEAAVQIDSSTDDTIDLLNESNCDDSFDCFDGSNQKEKEEAKENKSKGNKYEEKLNLFNNGNVMESDSFIDDHYDNTQNPFDDESF